MTVTLLLGFSTPLLAEEPPARDWLSDPSPAPEPSPQDPQLELFPDAQGIGIPDQHGISSSLREALREESERALNRVTEELSTL